MTVVAPRPPMKVAEFLTWAEAQPQGRYELVDGKIVAMAPERFVLGPGHDERAKVVQAMSQAIVAET